VAAVTGHGGVLAAVDAALAEHFAQQPVRASVSFVGVEPIEVLRFEPIPGERAYVSLGMSRRPMTGAAEVVQRADGPRAELMLQVLDPTDSFADVWRALAVLAAAPVVEGVVYSPGMTVDTGQPLAEGSRCTGAVLVESAVDPVTAAEGAVAVLQLLPATPNELAWCRVQGSAALRGRWSEQELDLADLARPGAALG
jgi:hypothetical protein